MPPGMHLLLASYLFVFWQAPKHHKYDEEGGSLIHDHTGRICKCASSRLQDLLSTLDLAFHVRTSGCHQILIALVGDRRLLAFIFSVHFWRARSYFKMHHVRNRHETRIWETSPWLSAFFLVVTSLWLRKLFVSNGHKSVRSKAFSSDHIVLLSWFFFICMAVKIEGFSIDSFDVQH